MTVYASANGQAIKRAKLVIGASGPWFADLEFDSSAPQVSGAVSILIGSMVLSGTSVPDRTGVFLESKSTRVVAGAGGWGGLIPAKAYHNDAGVKALNVATDAARAAGESLGAFVPESPRVGIDYVRQAGPAARALEDVIGSSLWWVDYAGVTNVGERPANTPAEADYDVQAYDPASKLVTLAVKDILTVTVGSVLTGGLDAPQTVRELEVDLSDGALVIKAWCGSSAPQSRLAGILQRIIERSTDGKLFGSYRYRVIKMSGDRVELQAVRKAAGLPDLLPLSMLPGVAGAHAVLAPGAEVLVEFIEGDRSMPRVTAFAGKDGTGFAPISLLLEVSTFLDLGGAGGGLVALAAKCDTEYTAIAAAIAALATAIPVVPSPYFFPGGPPTGLTPPLRSTAATKVRAL